MRQLNRRQIAALVESLDATIRTRADTPEGYIVGLWYSQIKRDISNKSLLTSDDYAKIVRKAVNDIMRPECEKAFLGEDNTGPKKVDNEMLRLQAKEERKFDEYCDRVNSSKRK